MSFTLPRGFALLRERRLYGLQCYASWYDWLLSGQPQRWQEGALLALAQGIHQTGSFHALPILADALEEAGCPYAGALAHCRDPHGRQHGYVHCWVVDDLLEASDENCDPDDIA